ncbi:MAG: GNAT family N-acetyltransferase [Syntrophales bacterium]|nr:GNAT family N-acetyltransferase [Syntrophales bacterium]
MWNYPVGDKIKKPHFILDKIRPGMSIFLGTGLAEPRTIVKYLLSSDAPNLQDLELVQLVSLGETVSLSKRYAKKFRLKTFFSGWVASDAIKKGRADLIPSRFSRISSLFATGIIRFDAAFVQVTPPDEMGYVSLGVGVDVARQAMEVADIVVGEINLEAPWTLGDTLVHVSEFDYLIESEDSPYYLDRWQVDETYLKIASYVASVVEDGACISFAIGPLYEALGKTLISKRDLGVHSPFFTDALMDLIKSGAVSNRKKTVFRGKSLTSYVIGTRELVKWLDRNPLVEFQPMDVVMDPKAISMNDNTVAILPARKVDLTGNIALHIGKGDVTAGPGVVQELFMGASLSRGGKTVFALPSRNRKGESNIVLTVDGYPYQFHCRESLDMVLTEYGIAYLRGRSLRERAQAIIDIAHPDDRMSLIEKAKEACLLYRDQIFIPESGFLYPERIFCEREFKDNLKVRFRAIKPSDEEEMRRLFYRFSDQAVYYRYFTRIRTMPHEKMQEYVNVDYRRTMSIVGVVEEGGVERIIAEARYVRSQEEPYADIAVVVDEQYSGRGIATFLLGLLAKTAREEGIAGFTAHVLVDNKPILRVIEKLGFPVKAAFQSGVYRLTIPFETNNKKGL